MDPEDPVGVYTRLYQLDRSTRTNLVFGAGHVGRDGALLLLLEVLPRPAGLEGAGRPVQGGRPGTLCWTGGGGGEKVLY